MFFVISYKTKISYNKGVQNRGGDYMRYNIRGENVEITQPMEEYIKTKIEKLSRYFNEEINATSHVKVKVYNNEQIVEITIPMTELTLRTEVSNYDFYASVDVAVDKLERQIRKYKTKINRKFREKESMKHFFNNKAFEGVQARKDNDDDAVEIVKTKRLSLKPMDVEEAILQMQLLDHSFFVFRNSDTNEVNTVYKRKDGRFGLIEPA